jgi:hypothetical protein
MMSLSRLHKLALASVAVTALAAGVATPANAADPVLSASHTDNVGGCTVTTKLQYDPNSNSSTLNVAYHNGQLFAACRETSGGKVTLQIPNTSIRVDLPLPVHKTMACGYFDPSCLHDVNQTFTDYQVLPDQLRPPLWSAVSAQVKTVGGYTDKVW